ncbi:MAG: protein kinase [Gammaproteobacteria bacterium]|nr:protein kinase [Gammaproteobacteria bacterium]MBI5617027.1 protein kinase [Gammaproteobacteria bacterium]
MLKKLGKYEILREVGRGSMGVVYQAYDPYIDRPVAVKVAMADALKDREQGERFRKMFFNEAHTAGMLRHPNILDIFDAGVDDDKCYIVMELVENGDTLRTFCRAENLLTLNKATEIIFHCAKALDYAHRQGVIHRDIKPSNILLTQDMDVKIADFSIAHINRTDLTQTMPMGFVGSPRYMSPEQIQEDTITSQTDLFSLGIVAYELLTGKHPFGGESFSSLIHRVINEEPTPLATFRSDLPPILEKIVFKALEKRPERRYRMGIDLASDLSMAFTHLARPQEEISAQEKFAYVKQLDFFRGFPDSEIWEIIRASVWQDIGPEQLIIREGDVDDSFYIISAGNVVVTKQGTPIGRLREGDCFGEMGFLNKIRRTATIRADGPVSLLKVNATLIEQVSQECQLRFCRVFLRVLTERLQKTTEMMVRQ